VVGKLGDELPSAGDVGERRGDEGLGRERRVTLGESGKGGKGGRVGGDDAGEDGELASDVRTREIVGGMGLL
jgi:hypothetical protein